MKTRSRQPFPFNRVYRESFCGECGKRYEDERTWTMNARIGSTFGLAGLFCSSCGNMVLPLLPSGEPCGCAAPPKSGTWCTICGGRCKALPVEKSNIRCADDIPSTPASFNDGGLEVSIDGLSEQPPRDQVRRGEVKGEGGLRPQGEGQADICLGATMVPPTALPLACGCSSPKLVL